MVQIRVIPCLLLHGRGLYKTIRFKRPQYLGDPINIVRLFNDKEADELIFLDITATVEGRGPPLDLLSTVTSECFMPLCYGGGVRTLEHMHSLYKLGVEKVSLNSIAVERPSFVTQAAKEFGSQSVVVSIDVRKRLLGGYRVCTEGGRKRSQLEPVRFAIEAENRGAGEILLNSIDRDGTMGGYDIDLLGQVSSAVNIPVIACGGAGSVQHLRDAVRLGGASAAAAGSMFVFQGRHRAVLISYPTMSDFQRTLGEEDLEIK